MVLLPRLYKQDRQMRFQRFRQPRQSFLDARDLFPPGAVTAPIHGHAEAETPAMGKRKRHRQIQHQIGAAEDLRARAAPGAIDCVKNVVQLRIADLKRQLVDLSRSCWQSRNKWRWKRIRTATTTKFGTKEQPHFIERRHPNRKPDHRTHASAETPIAGGYSVDQITASSDKMKATKARLSQWSKSNSLLIRLKRWKH